MGYCLKAPLPPVLSAPAFSMGVETDSPLQIGAKKGQALLCHRPDCFQMGKTMHIAETRRSEDGGRREIVEQMLGFGVTAAVVGKL